MLAHPNGKTGQGVDGFDVIGRRPGQLPLVADLRGHEYVTAEVAGMDDFHGVGEGQGPGSERASDRDGFLGDESAWRAILHCTGAWTKAGPRATVRR